MMTTAPRGNALYRTGILTPLFAVPGLPFPTRTCFGFCGEIAHSNSVNVFFCSSRLSSNKKHTLMYTDKHSKKDKKKGKEYIPSKETDRRMTHEL